MASFPAGLWGVSVLHALRVLSKTSHPCLHIILIPAENEIQLQITERQQQAGFLMRYHLKLSNLALLVY